MMVGQEAAQELQMRLAPCGNPLVIVTIRDGAAHDQQQHLGQWMGDTPLLPRVIDHRNMIQQCTKARLLRRRENGDAHGGGSESGATQPNQTSGQSKTAVNPSSEPCAGQPTACQSLNPV